MLLKEIKEGLKESSTRDNIKKLFERSKEKIKLTYYNSCNNSDYFCNYYGYELLFNEEPISPKKAIDLVLELPFEKFIEIINILFNDVSITSYESSKDLSF